MKTLNILSMILLANSAMAEFTTTTVCGVDVIKVTSGREAVEPTDITVMTPEQVLAAMPEACSAKYELERAIKSQREAEQRLAVAQGEVNQVMQRLTQQEGGLPE